MLLLLLLLLSSPQLFIRNDLFFCLHFRRVVLVGFFVPLEVTSKPSLSRQRQMIALVVTAETDA